ncbi:MAG: Head fiber protein [Oscillospiraceae bacterium]|jgi:hypothetical protein|nr:Head fiber protein [Oscillospiraceae bacterium]
MSYNTSNYHEQNGDEWVIGGKLTILPNATVTGLKTPVAEYQADSTAENVAGLVTDFNSLLAKLRAARLMELSVNPTIT